MAHMGVEAEKILKSHLKNNFSEVKQFWGFDMNIDENKLCKKKMASIHFHWKSVSQG